MRLHPTTTHRRHLLVATALVLGVLTTGCKPWGPVTSQYNGHTVVSGEGYTNISASRVSDTLTITDTLNDGNSVYGSARYYFWLAGSSGDWAWRQTAGDATPKASAAENRQPTGLPFRVIPTCPPSSGARGCDSELKRFILSSTYCVGRHTGGARVRSTHRAHRCRYRLSTQGIGRGPVSEPGH